MWSPVEIKRRRFPKGIRRAIRTRLARVFRRTTRRSVAATLARLAIPPRSVVCVHSMLSALGYLVDGPDGVIDAIRDAVPDATILVPTFPIEGTCAAYLAGDPVFDPASTPSTSGLLTEHVRVHGETLRSAHPTHPCAALGPAARELIEGSENAVTPFGVDSSYGRFASRDDAVLLLLHTNNSSLVHRFQEIAGTPNLFLDGRHSARSLAPDGSVRRFRVRVHRPKLPLYVALPRPDGGEPDYVWLPDYCLPAPAYNRERMRRDLAPAGFEAIARRHRDLTTAGVIRMVRHRRAEVIAIRAKVYTEALSRELAANYEAAAAEYAIDKLLAADRAGRFHH